ncbi:MAG: RimK/LysX family protein [Sedimenticolaceae bacterium]
MSARLLFVGLVAMSPALSLRWAELPVLAVLLLALTTPARAEVIVAGWIERVRLMDAGVEVEAKLDSGAENSSLHADELLEFERNGRPWVRFQLNNPDGAPVLFERPVVRTARIKRHLGESQPRPVIELTLCIGGLARRVEINLVDRGNFQYPLLVGRSFLSQGVLVDSAARYRVPPTCA